MGAIPCWATQKTPMTHHDPGVARLRPTGQVPGPGVAEPPGVAGCSGKFSETSRFRSATGAKVLIQERRGCGVLCEFTSRWATSFILSSQERSNMFKQICRFDRATPNSLFLLGSRGSDPRQTEERGWVSSNLAILLIPHRVE